MSGAGRSTALKALEDFGYEAVDNLPLAPIPALVEQAAADAPPGLGSRGVGAIAIGADLVIDTSTLSAADLRRRLYGHFALPGSRLRLFVTSFACRHGVPREADLVFAVRFLDNPHYGAALRPLCGLDPPVAAHIARDAEFKPFFARLWRLLRPLLPRYEREGKAYPTIAIGCTGGRHRSVFVAERLAAQLRSEGLPVEVAHRDLSASGSPAAPASGAAG
ncbi:MAG TPA: RNase adapter RapZ [Stellaceae bacterium]|nr:RNase adapter RapZ [Stellaceae bacterium]